MVLTKILSQPLRQNVLFSPYCHQVSLYEMTNQVGARRQKTFIFLASISLAFAGHVVLFWLWLPRRGETDGTGRQGNAEKDVRNVRDFSVKRLPSGGTRSCMPQQTRYAAVCADWEQKLGVFWSRSNPHRDRPRHCQWASSLVQRLWLARFVQAKYALWYRFEKRPPVTLRRSQIAPTQWLCGSNSTTAFGVYE